MSRDSTARPPDTQLVSKRAETDLVERRLRPGRHPSAMLERLSWPARLLGRILFGNIRIERRFIDNISDAAAKATVVYVMQTRSVLDYLYFNFAFLAHALPLSRFANNVRTVLFRPLFSMLRTVFQRRYPPGADVLERAVEGGESALIFLQRPRDEEWGRHRFSQELLKRLVDVTTRGKARDIILVPLMLVWEKRPDSYQKSVLDEVFGTPQRPGRFRKLLHLVKNLWQSLVRAGSPTVQVSSTVDLTRFVRANELLTRREKAMVLDEKLVDAFDRERQVIVGPPIKPAALIRKEVVQSERVDSEIQVITRSKPEYPSVVKKQAGKIIKEIAADFNLLTLKFLSAVVNPIFDTLYQGFEIDSDGLNRVRETARDCRLVLMPSHKSHLDYMIISNVFYQHGLMPPHIAAGANLSFWPLGSLFRRAGAFFLRRSFHGDSLYSAIFTEYLVKILKEGFPVEFFIEGTRSRTGKLMRPRFGLLAMIVQAVLDNDLERVALVPISVGYERVVEVGSYQRELSGGEKSTENLSGVIKATRVLRAKYGRVYVEFDEPILLHDVAAEHELSADLPRKSFDRSVRRLAYQILAGINRVTTVTPSAVVATALLSSNASEVEQAELLAQTGFIANYLVHQRARLSNSIHNALVNRDLVLPRTGAPGDNRVTHLAADDRQLGSYQRNAAMGLALEEVAREAVQLLANAGSLKVRTSKGRSTYLLSNENRLELSYYRNNIVHFFGTDAIVATLLAAGPGSSVSRGVLWERGARLSQLLKFEFCLTTKSESLPALERSLAFLVECGWLKKGAREGVYEKLDPEPRPLAFFRQLLVSWLESYWVAARSLEELIEQPMTEKDWLKACLKKGRRLFQEGAVSMYEALSKPAFKNAFASFKARRVIEPVEDDDRRGADSVLQLAEPYRSPAPIDGIAGEYRSFLAGRQSDEGRAVAPTKPLQATP